MAPRIRNATRKPSTTTGMAMARENLVAQSATSTSSKTRSPNASPNWPSTASRPAAITLPDDVNGA